MSRRPPTLGNQRARSRGWVEASGLHWKAPGGAAVEVGVRGKGLGFRVPLEGARGGGSGGRGSGLGFRV
jgi:hypothetical protein